MGNNIIIPYSGRIPGGIQVGTEVVIAGRVQHHCSRFSLNLCVGPTYDQDCALHFNPRFDEGAVVRNHHQGGSWGPEERSGGNPFKKGHGFDLRMTVLPHGYKVTVNHRHFCDFNHRLPKESVQYIYIAGDVSINYIQFKGNNPYPSAPPSFPGYSPPSYPTGSVAPPSYPPAPSYPPTPGYPGMAAGPIFNPPVPFTTPINGGLYPGRIIYIQGVPHPNPSRFTVNLQCGPYDSGDLALHFDVRFNYGDSRNVIVRTHKQGGDYGPEEKNLTYFPFMPNANFEMMILTEPGSFKVAVNNQHLLEFFHRLQPFNRADHVNVSGDITLTQVRFQ